MQLLHLHNWASCVHSLSLPHSPLNPINQAHQSSAPWSLLWALCTSALTCVINFCCLHYHLLPTPSLLDALSSERFPTEFSWLLLVLRNLLVPFPPPPLWGSTFPQLSSLCTLCLVRLIYIYAYVAKTVFCSTLWTMHRWSISTSKAHWNLKLMELTTKLMSPPNPPCFTFPLNWTTAPST